MGRCRTKLTMTVLQMRVPPEGQGPKPTIEVFPGPALRK